MEVLKSDLEKSQIMIMEFLKQGGCIKFYSRMWIIFELAKN